MSDQSKGDAPVASLSSVERANRGLKFATLFASCILVGMLVWLAWMLNSGSGDYLIPRAGMAISEVQERLGEPSEVANDGEFETLTYTRDKAKLTMRFRDSKLVSWRETGDFQVRFRSQVGSCCEPTVSSDPVPDPESVSQAD